MRVRGTAVFMTSTPDGVPVVLLHHLKHNKVLHETVVLLTVQTRGIPEVGADDHLTFEPIGQGFFRVARTTASCSRRTSRRCWPKPRRAAVAAPPMDTTYYLGRERLVLTGRAKMSRWRKKLFALMSRNARSATEFFQIPPNRVVELGAQIEF